MSRSLVFEHPWRFFNAHASSAGLSTYGSIGKGMPIIILRERNHFIVTKTAVNMKARKELRVFFPRELARYFLRGGFKAARPGAARSRYRQSPLSTNAAQ
jgi:hypothetical protein